MSQNNLPSPETAGLAQQQATGPETDATTTPEAVYARYAAEAAALRAQGREAQYRGPSQPGYVSTEALLFMDDVTARTARRLLARGFFIDVGRFAGRSDGAFPPARVDARLGVALNIANASRPPFRILRFDPAGDEAFRRKLWRLAGLRMMNEAGSGGDKHGKEKDDDDGKHKDDGENKVDNGKDPRPYERKRFRHGDLIFWFTPTDDFWNLCDGIFDTRPDIVKREAASRKASWHMKNDSIVYVD